MENELTHLGYEKYLSTTKKNGNSRNGRSSKAIEGDFGDSRSGWLMDYRIVGLLKEKARKIVDTGDKAINQFSILCADKTP